MKPAQWKPARVAWRWYRRMEAGRGYRPGLAVLGSYSLRLEHPTCLVLYGPVGSIAECNPLDVEQLFSVELLTKAAELLHAIDEAKGIR